MSSETMCIQCGQPAGDPLRLNHMPNGKACVVCRDRLLDSLPAPFPAAVTRENEAGQLFSTVDQPAGADASDGPIGPDGIEEPGEPDIAAESEGATHLRALPPMEPGVMPYEDDGGYTPSA